ncbi:hypothetical protein Gotur_025405 [Gossypium turneri]
MANEFLDKVEDNAIVRIWSEKVQLEKGDSLAKDYVSELWDYTRISVTQNSLQELNEIWDQWNDETKQLFYSIYGDLPYLLNIKVDERLFRVLAQYWNPAYSYFTFGNVVLVPTVEEYTALLHCPRLQVDKAYSKAAYVPAFWKKLKSITGISEQWITARIKQKGECKCIPWRNLRDLILAHPDGEKKVDVFALSIYGLVIFPRALAHVDEAVSDLFDQLGKGVTPVPAILTETFRSLNVCRRAGEGRFIEDDVEWIAPWLIHDGILYPCESFDWVPLLGIWGAVGYAPLLSVRPMEEYLQVIPSELEIIKQDFKKRNLELEKKIELLEEEKMHLRLDVDVQKLEAEKLKKGKNKVEEDLDSLKIDYKRKSRETQVQKETLERQVLETQNYQADLKARIAKLERSLAAYRSRNSVVELKTSLCKIDEMKKRIEELEAIAQIREVADHLQTMAIQADVLSVKYELELDRGQELASLLKEVRALSIRAKRYL